MKITIIIVLYKKLIEESISYISLIKNMKSSRLNFDLIIYNNSPEIHISESHNYQLVNSKIQGKLPEAYNYALNIGSEWLLLLDQDTLISVEYVEELEKKIDVITTNINIVAIVPKLVDRNITLSPKAISKVGYWENQIKSTGIQLDRIIAFNSLSLLNVNFIKSIGGFSDKYQLDMLDHWYYNQIYLNNKFVFVLESNITHNLSFQNYENDVSLNRHIEFLNAEKMFVDELNLLHFISYKIKLALRSLKQFLIFKNKEYSKLTFKKLISY